MALNFQGPSRKQVGNLTEGEHDFSTRPNESLYFFDCSNATVNVNSRCVKVSLENMKNCTAHIKNSPLTSFLEIVNCDGLHVHLEEGVIINTVTVDGSDNVIIHVTKAEEQVAAIYWHKVSKLYVDRGGDAGLFLLDKIEENNKITIFQHVCKPQPDGTFSKDPVMRENGYPTTEVEKIEADAKQRQFEQAMIKEFLKNVDLKDLKGKGKWEQNYAILNLLKRLLIEYNLRN